MIKLLYYRTRVFMEENLAKYPDLVKFRHYFKLYSLDVMPIDRSGVIKVPFNVVSIFPIPKLVPFTKSYEQVCNERAIELLKKSDDLNIPLKIMYSGGIDSTVMLISLIKNANQDQMKRIVVLLSEESIQEYPKFYEEHIIGKLKVEPSLYIEDYIGSKKHILVTGEHNDQVFGSDIIGNFVRRFSMELALTEYTREKIVNFFNLLDNNIELNNFYFDLFDNLCKKAPVKIVTVYDFFWWINFSCKWQCVFFRSLMYASAKNKSNIDKVYIEKNYFTFFNTDNFQLWSMTNMDKKIKNEWKSYKYPAKEVIFNFTKDEDYFLNKPKVASLGAVVVENRASSYIDENFKLLDGVKLDQMHNPDNSFT